MTYGRIHVPFWLQVRGPPALFVFHPPSSPLLRKVRSEGGGGPHRSGGPEATVVVARIKSKGGKFG